jgi:hypothetical protein
MLEGKGFEPSFVDNNSLRAKKKAIMEITEESEKYFRNLASPLFLNSS